MKWVLVLLPLLFLPITVFGSASPIIDAFVTPPPGALELHHHDDDIIALTLYIEKGEIMTLQGKYIQLPAGDDDYDVIPSYSDPLRYSIPIRIDHNYDDEKFNVSVDQEGVFSFKKRLEIENPNKPFEVTIFHKAKWTMKVEPFYITPNMYPSISRPSIVVNDQSSEQSIPTWVKSNAYWWSQGQLDDQTFISGMQYLISIGVIQVTAEHGDSTSSGVPQWVKDNAAWWADGLISDNEFLTGITFLIESGVIIL